jgi:aspartate/methionine/tyrosine aminotransferase
MGRFLDDIPYSGIARIRDMMYAVKDPYRLDQGDVCFEAPESVKKAIIRALNEGHTHYLQTNGLPQLRLLLTQKMRHRNRIPVDNPEEVLVTNGGIHGLYLLFQALLEPGDEVLVPDPIWPPAWTIITTAQGVPVGYPLYEERRWRFDPAEVASLLTPRTRALYINTPSNPTGGVLTRQDLEFLAALAREHDLWVISDEAYEDVLFDDAEHVSVASMERMHERTVSLFSFSKSYAVTGLRLGYLAVANERLRERMTKLLFLTTANVSSIAQYGAAGALLGSQAVLEEFRVILNRRRDLFYSEIGEASAGVLGGQPPLATFYAFVRIAPGWTPEKPAESRSWAMAEMLIERGRIGCIPGADFGPHGEGYIRFCFARERAELADALTSMRRVFGRE